MAADSGNLRTAAVERGLRTAAGDSEKLLLEPIGGDLFRVEESSFITDAVYRDVIRATETDDGALLFVEIAERSPLVTNSWILSQELIQSDAVQLVLKQIMDQGGNWNRCSEAGSSCIRRPRQLRRPKSRSVVLQLKKSPMAYKKGG